jgi:hypothetical protein
LTIETRDAPLFLVPVMRHGKRTAMPHRLAELQQSAAANLQQLPAELHDLRAFSYSVAISSGLGVLANSCDQRIAAQNGI